MQDKEYVIIVSEVRYRHGPEEAPLMQKLNDKESAILTWKTTEEAEAFIQKSNLPNHQAKKVPGSYIKGLWESYARQDLTLKIREL